MDIPVYKAVLGDDDEGMDFNSWVDRPAHSKAFELFNKNEKKVHKFFDEERRIVTGVAVATDTPIYRNSPDMGEFYVYFDKEQTFRIAHRMMKNGFLHNVNEMHDSNRKVKGVSLVESYFIDRKRGVNEPTSFKNQNLKDGTWIVSYFVEDNATWEKLKSGEFTGFSIEVWMSIQKTSFKNQKQKIKTEMKKPKKSLFKVIMEHFNDTEEVTEEETKLAEVTTVDGATIVWDGEMAVGTEVRMRNEDGKEILAPEGVHSYANEDGKNIVITIDANGIVTELEEVETETEEAEVPVEEEMEKSDEVLAAIEELANHNKAIEKERDEFKAKYEAEVSKTEKLQTELQKEPKKPTPKTGKVNLTEILKSTNKK